MAQVKKASAAVEGNVLTISFAHGEEITINANDLPGEMKSACLLHGLKQKVCDSYSGSKTPAEAMEKAGATIKAIMEGNWTVRVAGEGGVRVTQLAQALANATGKSLEEAVEVVGGLTAEAKKELAKVPAITQAIAKIQLEKAQAAAAAAEGAAEEGEGMSIADILAGGGEEAA
jgi:hypothetical protein